MLNSSYLQFVVHGQGAIEQMSIANMKVSINDGSDWKTFSVLLKPSQRLKKNEIGWR